MFKGMYIKRGGWLNYRCGCVTVEPRLIYASHGGIYGSAKGCLQVVIACMQPEGRFYMAGKARIVVDVFSDL
jgi:hypothetical protein